MELHWINQGNESCWKAFIHHEMFQSIQSFTLYPSRAFPPPPSPIILPPIIAAPNNYHPSDWPFFNLRLPYVSQPLSTFLTTILQSFNVCQFHYPLLRPFPSMLGCFTIPIRLEILGVDRIWLRHSSLITLSIPAIISSLRAT